jgi:hypothetical protein
MNARFVRRFAWPLLALACACSAYDARYDFEPRPFELGHVLPGGADRAASVLVSVVGVRKRDPERQLPASVEIRLRVDSQSDDEVRLEPDALQLFAANLEAFPAPLVPDGALVVAGHGSGLLTAYFPFPDDEVPGTYDLGGLGLRWTLTIGGHPSTGNATFALREDQPREYYPIGFFGFSTFGYGRHHHHFDEPGRRLGAPAPGPAPITPPLPAPPAGASSPGRLGR